jgi:putative FmdB family regulatory protein
MPTYAYKCANCGHRFDIRQRYYDDPLTDCPNCEDGQIRRVISQVNVVFKGSGFYVTDNRNGKGKGSSKASDGGKTGSSDYEKKEKKSSPKENVVSEKPSSGKTETANAA